MRQPANRFLIASLSVSLVENTGEGEALDPPSEEAGGCAEFPGGSEMEGYERGEEDEDGEGEREPGPEEMRRGRPQLSKAQRCPEYL